MRVSQYWRSKSSRYRLQGVRNQDGIATLQSKATLSATKTLPQSHEVPKVTVTAKVPAA